MIQNQVNKDKVEEVSFGKNNTNKSHVAKYIKDFLVYNMTNELKKAFVTTLANETVDMENTEKEFFIAKENERTEFSQELEDSAETTLPNSDNYLIEVGNTMVIDESDYVFNPVSPGENNFGFYNSHPGYQVGDSEPRLNNKNLNLPKKIVDKTISESQKKVIRKKGFSSLKQQKIRKLRLENNLKTNKGKIKQFLGNSNLVKEKLNKTINKIETSLDTSMMFLAEQNPVKEELSEKTFESHLVKPYYNGNYSSKQKCKDCVVKIERLPILDRLLTSKEQNPRWDISICDLCEPKRLFLSKNALKTHIYEQHMDSLFLTVVSKVSLGTSLNNNLISIPMVCQSINSPNDKTNNRTCEPQRFRQVQEKN